MRNCRPVFCLRRVTHGSKPMETPADGLLSKPETRLGARKPFAGKKKRVSPCVVVEVCQADLIKRMISVGIQPQTRVKQDLYTYQNPKKSHSVDNMVDNVDKLLWITHASFVNNIVIRTVFTHGKLRFLAVFLQEFLPLNSRFTMSFCAFDPSFTQAARSEKREESAPFRGFFGKMRRCSGGIARVSIYCR